MPMVALSPVWGRRVVCFIAMCLLALPTAHADPMGDTAAPAAGLSAQKLEGHLWRIDSVSFERPMRRDRYNHIRPSVDDGSDAYIAFENGEVSGSLGCGQFSGQYNMSDDRVEISSLSGNHWKRCGHEFNERADEVISALRSAARIERGVNAFYLFDEQQTSSIRLELFIPGFDLSEFFYSFWRLVSLEEKSIAEPNIEVRLDGQSIGVSMGAFGAEFAFRYRWKKFIAEGRFSASGPANGMLPPFFETFGQALHRIASYSANGDDLAAVDPSGKQIMLLRRIRPTGLEYRYWQIAAYGMDGLLNPTSGFVTFVRGELQGRSGCGGFKGNYTLAGDSLSLHAGTLSYTGWCAVAAENEQHLIIYALNKASRVKEDGGRVLLQDAQGSTNIVLVSYAQQTPH